jgi:hypothetical protein
MNPHSLNPYKTYAVTFQAVADESCTVVVSGIRALCSESAATQGAQIFKGQSVFRVIAIDSLGELQGDEFDKWGQRPLR